MILPTNRGTRPNLSIRSKECHAMIPADVFRMMIRTACLYRSIVHIHINSSL